MLGSSWSKLENKTKQTIASLKEESNLAQDLTTLNWKYL